MKLQNVTEILQKNYRYPKNSPILHKSNYKIYSGVQNDSKLPVTIKILQKYKQEHYQYLKKIKNCRSQYVIKIYQIFIDSSTLVCITQEVKYGTLQFALSQCERLEDSDAIVVSKSILSGYMDLMRNSCEWVGNQEHIEFTELGVKLSWNYSSSVKEISIGKILQKLYARNSSSKDEQSNILPFPKNKVMEELIRISAQSVSQIAFHPQMKKKEKIVRKKGKDWIGLKETKNKNQYYDELIYLAVHCKYGFVRVKVYEKGAIDGNILILNQKKNTFTKVLDCYEEEKKTVIVSQYSNDGSLHNYVNKLKNSGIVLNEEKIQFFLFSLFEPLKQVQSSSLKSINMLHIKNIYIQNGIPKIGEPIPLNKKIQEILINREEVPDFYHSEFKRSPSTHQETYDTYSLGVLLYKLMYTEYPIFPKGTVHIPTTPSYNPRLKQTLRIFLDSGGKLSDIEKRIEISDRVVKKVEENKQKLLVVVKKQVQEKKKKIKLKQKFIYDDEQQQEYMESQKQQDHQQQTQDHINCCSLCCMHLDLTNNQASSNRTLPVLILQQSPYKIYRICTKILLTLLLFIFLFYFFFLRNVFAYLSSTLTTHEFNIFTDSHQIITPDVQTFETSFGKTNGSYAAFSEMGCFDDSDSVDFFINSSTRWMVFMISSLFVMVVLLVVKSWQIYNFDIIKAWYNMDHWKYNFNLSHFIVFQLGWAFMLYGHYYFYHFIFDGGIQPCLSSDYLYASSYNLIYNSAQFNRVYLTTFLLQLLALFLHTIMIGCTHRVHYNKLINPLMLFLPLLVAQWVIIRIGVVNDYFNPNMLNDQAILQGYFGGNFSITRILGLIPELVVVIELIIGFFIDLIYWMFLDKRRRMLIAETSAASLEL